MCLFRRKKDNCSLMDIGLTADVHSHILPGVDDGSPDTAESTAILEEMHRLGIRKVMFTPHVSRAMFTNTAADLQARFAAFLPALPESIRKDMTFHLASEYMVDEFFVEAGDRLCWPDGKHILIEMSYYERSPKIKETVFELGMEGLQPVLAHPERYVFYQQAFDRKKGVKELETLVDMGCFLQLNLLSLTGAYGEASLDIVRWLLESDFYRYLGTDVHSRSQLDRFTGFRLSAGQLEKVRQLARNNETLFV